MAGSTGKQLNQINQRINLTVNTAQARQQLQSLYTQLNSITKGTNLSNGLGITNELIEANKAAAQLKVTLAEALNPNTGNLNLTAFSDQLRMQNMSLAQYRDQLASLGSVGDRAFTSLAKSIVTAEAPITRLGKWGQELTTTLGNTVRWQMTSSLLHGVMSTASQAMNYVKSLDRSLNDIRIVTGQSDEQMQRFARTANTAAKALNTTTNAYAQASLIYYQQGLSDKQVQERTAATIKLANVAGESAAKVSDQLTAVWNNFYDGSKSLEYYVDVMTALGASTASSTDEIAKGLEKFSSIAKTTGLSYEYATSALSTVVAATRQSADTVGTSFKTLFSRLQGLSLGETLDDGTTLNKYSKALNTIGVNIKNANGSLKDMDDILDEIGERWASLSKAEQVALAQTVGGARNYTGLVSLMDNWDDFQKNLQTAQNAQGALQKQADIYAESWDAASKHVRTASETIYKNLLDDRFFKGLTNGFGDILDVIGAATNAMGGFRGVMALATSFATTKFAPQVSQGIADLGMTIQGITPWGRQRVENLRQEAIQQMLAPTSNTGSPLGAIEAQYAVNLATRSEAYRKATTSGKISSWQQPIYQQLMQNAAQQEDVAVKAFEYAQNLQREGRNYSYQLQRETNYRLNTLSAADKAAFLNATGYDTGTGRSTTNPNRPTGGTMQQLYAAGVQAATGLQYASRLNTVLQPFVENQGISLNNIQSFMGTLQGLSEIAGRTTGGSVTRLFGLNQDSQFNIDQVVSGLLTAYNNAGGKITLTNQQQFIDMANKVQASLLGATEESRGLYFDQEEKFRNIIDNLYAADPRMASKILGDYQNRMGQISGSEAERQFQQSNALRSHQYLQDLISGTKGEMTFSQTLTTATSAATTLGYSYLQAANAVKVFQDETSTATDKMGALVGIGMTLPNTIQASTNLMQSFGKTLKGTGISGGLASLALAAAVGGGIYLNNQYKQRYENNTLEAQAKEASKQAVTTQQIATNAQEAYDSFVAISENQAKAQQEIYNNINGSSAQTLAIINANQQAIEMISKYGLTSDQWSIGALGEISIASSVKKEIEDQLLEESKDATTNALVSNLTASLVQNLNEQEAMSTRGVYRISGLETKTGQTAMLLGGAFGIPGMIAAGSTVGGQARNFNTNDIIEGWYQYAADNPNATFEQYAKSIGLTKQIAQVHGFTDELGNISPVTLFGGAKEYIVNAWNGKTAYNQFAENLGLSPYASFEEVQKAISTLDLTKENNELEIKNYTQGIISAVAANNKEYSEDIKQLAAIYATEQINSDEIYELAREGLKKDNRTEEEKAIYRELYNKEADETYDETTLQGLIIAKRINDSVEKQLNDIYANIEEEGKVFKSYNTFSRESLSRTLAENAENKYADLIRQKQIDSDRSLYEALVAQMPVGSFSTDLKDFQTWLSGQDMSIQTQQQLEGYIIDFGTTFGQETVKWVYDNFTGEEYSKEFRASFRAALDKTDLTGGAISNLYNIRRTSRSYADTGSDAAIRKNLNTLYEKAISDLGGDTGLLTSLLNSSDFASVLEKLTSSFEITGQLTADQISAAAAKSEILSQFLDISNVNTGGLATVIRELSSGNLNINQVSTPLLQAFSTAAAPESQRIRGISALTDFDYANSIESAFTQYFKDTKKAISPGWYGGVFYDAPINQFLNQMSTSNQEKYRANVTRMINEGWTTQQFQNQLKVDAPELYSYIEKVTSKKGADEFDMFDIMNSENAFNGPMIYDPKTGQLRYNTDYWKDNEEAETEYAKWFKENEYKDLVNSDGTLKNLGTTQRAIQAMMAYQFRHVYSGAEADRKAEYIATYMHDAGNGPMWDKNAAIQGAKDLANSGLVFDDQYRAYFNENAALLGYEPTEEGYQKFVSDYFQIQTATSASNIPGTNISRGTTRVTQRITPVNREALKNVTNLEDLNNILAGHITGVLNGGSGLDTLLRLNGAVLDENGTLDYDKTRQILEEQLGLSPDKIDAIMKEKTESGSVFSKMMYNSKTGTYEPILSSENGWTEFRNQIENPEETNKQYELQDQRDFALETELDLLEGQKGKDEARIALFNRMSEDAQERYRGTHQNATWIPTKQKEDQSEHSERDLQKDYNRWVGAGNTGSIEDMLATEKGYKNAQEQQAYENWIGAGNTGGIDAFRKEQTQKQPLTPQEEVKEKQQTVDELKIEADNAQTTADELLTEANNLALEGGYTPEVAQAYSAAREAQQLADTAAHNVQVAQAAENTAKIKAIINPNGENYSNRAKEWASFYGAPFKALGNSFGEFIQNLGAQPYLEPFSFIPNYADMSQDELDYYENVIIPQAQQWIAENGLQNEYLTSGIGDFVGFAGYWQSQSHEQFKPETSLIDNMPEQTVENEDVLNKWALDALDELDLDEDYFKSNLSEGKENGIFAYQYLQTWLKSQDTETQKAIAEQLKIEKLIAENTQLTAESTTAQLDYLGEEEDTTQTRKAIGQEKGQILDEEGKPIELPSSQQVQTTTILGSSNQSETPVSTGPMTVQERLTALDAFNKFGVSAIKDLSPEQQQQALWDKAEYDKKTMSPDEYAKEYLQASGQNNARLLAYASGKEGHIAVTGELGPELRIKSDGSMDVLGKTGREYAWVEPDDKIYTASQSAGILKSNKIPGLEGLAKGINNFIPGYADGQTYVGTPGRPSGSGGGGSSSRGGSGGGGGDEKDPRYDPNTLKIRDILERYYTILQQVDDITKAVEHIGKAIDRGWGQERIKNLERQEKLLESQYKMQEAYVKEIKDYLQVDKNALTTMVTDFVKEYNEGKNNADKINLAGALFDENGVLTNYKDIVQKLVDKYNENAEANAQNKEEQYKFQERLKDIQMYTDTLNQLQEAEEKLYDLNNQILDTRIRQITYRIEYENEMDANDLKLINFQYDQIADNAYRSAEAIDLVAQKSGKVIDQINRYENGFIEILGQYFDQDLTDRLVKMFRENPAEFAKEWQKIMETDPRYQDITDEHKGILENYMDGIIDGVKTLWDNYDKTIATLGDDIKTFGKTLDGIISKFDYFNSVYDSLNNIIGLTNRSLTNIDATFMKTLSDKQLENNMNKFRSASREVQTMNKALEEATSIYNAALKEQMDYTGNDYYTKKELQDQVDNAKKALDLVIEQNENATKQFYDAWEACLKAVEERYKVAMQEVGRDFEKSISPYFMTLELLQNQYDREKELKDLYVRDYQRIHDLSKLNRDIQNSIDDTDNLKGKQRLRDLQEEINDLQENGNDLSEYDLDILQKKYDLELARQALEDAKDAKSMVRLSRDNNGNWSYVYTSNQDDIDEAEQNYEDKIRDMEQANEDYIIQMQDQIVNLTAQARQALEGLNPADFASPEEFQQYLDNLIKYYQDRLNFATSQLNNATGNNAALAPDIQKMYENLDHNLTTNPGQTILSAIFGTQNLDDAVNNIVDGISNMAGEAFKTYATVYSEMQKEVYGIAGVDIANAASSLGDIIETIATASTKQVEVMDKEATRIDDAYTDTINAIQAYQTSLMDLISKTNEATTSLAGLNTFLHSSGEYIPTNTLYEQFQTAYKNVAGYSSGGYTGRWQYADTGMYTGEWPDGSSRRNGRLAWLHQKELVLNAHDTENFLDAMQIVRQLDNLTNWMANGLGDLMMPRVSSTEGELNQNVHIEAEFPNVTDHNEIEQALGNLVNMASQYANRK